MSQNVNDIIIEVFTLIEVPSKKKKHKVTKLFLKLLVLLYRLVSQMNLYFKTQEKYGNMDKAVNFQH